MQRTNSPKLILLSIIALTLFHAGPVRAASPSNLTSQRVIDFGSFTGKVTMCGFGAETPVNHEKASPGHKFILISVKVIELADKAEVDSSLFVLEGSQATFEKPGTWGKTEFMGSMHAFEGGSGSAVTQSRADVDVNLFFEAPESARLEGFTLKYR
ncbi:MAG: hypothetical protein ABSF70_12295 [Terracidiphilus sp.]